MVNLSYVYIILIFVSGISLASATQYFSERILTTDTAPQLVINGTKTNGGGAVIALWGDGSTTPNKYIRTTNGEMDILNNNYQIITKIKDNGNMYTTSVVQAN